MNSRHGRSAIRIGAALAAYAVALTLCAPPASAAPGDLDPSFSRNGKVTIDLGLRSVWPFAVGQLTNGRIVVVGSTDFDPNTGATNVVVVRLMENGSLDRSFSRDGKQVVRTPGNQEWFGASIGADGGVTVVGQQQPFPGTYAVAQIQARGRLDPGFAGGSGVKMGFATGSAEAILRQPDGKLVVGGTTGALARLRPDGSLDPTFSDDGAIRIRFWESSLFSIADLARTEDGRIVATGYVGRPDHRGFAVGVARLLPDGALDTSFGLDGVVAPDFGEFGTSVATQGDGRIVVGGVRAWYQGVKGEGDSTPLLARLQSDGSLDRSFGVLTELPVFGVEDVAVQPGKILGVGISRGFGSDDDVVLLSRTEDGSPDESFPAGRGRVRVDLGKDDQHPKLTIQDDGKAVVAAASDRRKVVNRSKLRKARRLRTRAKHVSSRRKARRLRLRAKRLVWQATTQVDAVVVVRVLTEPGRPRR